MSQMRHSRRYCHVRYPQYRTLPRPIESRVLVVFLRPICNQPQQPPQLLRPDFGRSGEHEVLCGRHRTKKTLKIDPMQAETVRLIFRLAREGDGSSR